MPQRQKIEFAANLPTQVQLDGYGTLQQSKSGDEEFRYFLAGDRIMWVPPPVHDVIREHQDAIGQSDLALTITKHQAKRGARIDWQVEMADLRREPAPPPQRQQTAQAARPAPQAPPEMERTPRQGWIAREPARPAATAPQPAAQLAEDAAELTPTPADRMAQAMRDSIELWRGARTMEPELRPNAGDIRATATTLFIEMSGGKR